MKKNNLKLENFEQDFASEISLLQNIDFKNPEYKTFSIPSYSFVYTRAISFAFAVPAFVIAMVFFFTPNNVGNKNLALIVNSLLQFNKYQKLRTLPDSVIYLGVVNYWTS